MPQRGGREKQRFPWVVDKNLKNHGLIQAFTRTNRVRTNTKPLGRIVDFRQQQQRVLPERNSTIYYAIFGFVQAHVDKPKAIFSFQ